MDRKQDQETANADKKNWLEWAVFGISLTLVLAILAYLGYMTYVHKPTPPDLVVEVKPDPSAHSPHRYHVLLLNKGGATAEEVLVEVALMQGGKEVEKGQLQIPFAPQDSKKEGWVAFSSKPSQADSVLTRVVSYKKP
ncbi:hypothetical protein [Pontibacter actiniarum]|uniref:TIGR02588 family protein n=1 Tax=Pontibacter actiniarum TaxID=323450 RepID=A0A1X9YY96_9BACT|nr:hypothetical protein [Pontibacter actiniarum]ARS37714.1 hypothetical protein CA264_04135 [Pontibacter actiniarum]